MAGARPAFADEEYAREELSTPAPAEHLVAYSGMRWGERVALTWEQVDSDRRRIRLTGRSSTLAAR